MLLKWGKIVQYYLPKGKDVVFIMKKILKFGQNMHKNLRKCLLVATFKSFRVKSGHRFALGSLVNPQICTFFEF